MTRNVIGWDIGGAHLKAVLIDADGRVERAIQLACPLWRGTHELKQAIHTMLTLLAVSSKQAVSSAVTMTGELVDLFPNRHTGVCEIATIAHTLLGDDTRFYAGDLGFVPYASVSACSAHIASMNWHASARYVARHITNGLFVDIGSTTTDLIAIEQGNIAHAWRTDSQRMAHHALVYTGVVRTPLMAITPTISFQALPYHVAAEHFATTADVYRLLAQLPAHDDDAETADGQDKSVMASARRIARMIGHDVEEADMADWLALASAFKAAQLAGLKHAIAQHPQHASVLVCAGAGHFLVAELAQSLAVPCIHVENWLRASDDLTRNATNICFPAYAVAQLSHHDH